MGRFFKATPTTFLDDAMYQHPTDLMKQALMTKEKDAQQRLSVLEGVDNELEVDPHNKDRKDANKIVNEISRRKDSLVDDFYKNPDMNATRRAKLTKLQRDIKRQVTRGEIKKINDNNKFIKERKKTLLEQYDKNPEKFKAFDSARDVEDYVDYKYRGAIGEGGELNDPDNFSLVESNDTMTDIKKAFEMKTGKNYTSDITDKEFRTKIKTDGFTDQDIEDVMDSYIESSDKIQSAVQQEWEVRKASGENDLTRSQVKNKYASRLKNTAKDQLGQETVLYSRKPVNKKESSSGSDQGEGIDPSALVKVERDIPKTNELLSNAFKEVDFSSPGISSLDVVQKVASGLEEQQENIRKRLGAQMSDLAGEDFEGDLFNEATGMPSEALLEAVNDSEVETELITKAKLAKLKGVQASNFRDETPQYIKDSISQMEMLHNKYKAAEGEEKEKIGNEIQEAKKAIEMETNTAYLLNEQLNKDNWKSLQNEKDNYSSRFIVLPNSGTFSNAGEPGSVMTIGDALKNLKEQNPEMFRESTKSYKLGVEKTTEGNTTTYTDQDGNSQSYDGPTIEIRDEKNQRLIVIEESEIEIEEQNLLSANKVSGHNVALTNLKIGSESYPIMLNADKNALVTEGTKKKLESARQQQSGILALRDQIHGPVITKENDNYIVNRQLRKISGKIPQGKNESSMAFEIREDGSLYLNGDRQNDRKDIENFLNLIVKDPDIDFSYSE